jgi:hypothetical protein
MHALPSLDAFLSTLPVRLFVEPCLCPPLTSFCLCLSPKSLFLASSNPLHLLILQDSPGGLASPTSRQFGLVFKFPFILGPCNKQTPCCIAIIFMLYSFLYFKHNAEWPAQRSYLVNVSDITAVTDSCLPV